MSDNISEIIANMPALLAQGGYWITALVVILEGVPIAGSFLPGHVVIIAAGFLAKLGILNLWFVIIVGSIGAIIGDTIGFFVGKKYGYSFLVKFGKYIFIKERHIEKVKTMIDGHTGKTLILGKFSPLTRPLAPFLVGASGASFKTFMIFNVIGAILWVAASVIVGYVFGASYIAASRAVGAVIVIALIVTILIIWGYRFINKRFHIFKKYELFVLILNLLSLWGLAKTLQDAFSLQPFLINLDEWVSEFTIQHISPPLISLASWVSTIGGTKVMIGLGLVIGLIFIYQKKWRRGAIMLVSVLSTSVAVLFLKEIISRARPEEALYLYNLTDPSFPSGHASLAAAFFVALAYIFAPRISSWMQRELVIVVCVVGAVAVGLSRIVLNVHWASDIIAGWSLGVFLTTTTILLVRYVGGLFLKDK